MVEITVVVTAYNRKEFLPEALGSLQEQTLDKNLFEIVLISNFDYDLSWIRDIPVKHINMEGTLGEYVYRGVAESSGDIVCFLDDDDLFHRDKLKRILETFDQDTIFQKNAILPFWGLEDLKGHQGALNGNITVMENAGLLHPNKFAYNKSSISLRKVFISKYIEKLRSMNTSEDWFFFFSFYTEGGKGLYDESQSTFYRKHHSTSQKVVDRNDPDLYRYMKFLGVLTQAFSYMKSVFPKSDIQMVLDFQLAIFRSRRFLLSPGTDTLIEQNDLKNLRQASRIKYNENWIVKFLYIRTYFALKLPMVSNILEHFYVWGSKFMNRKDNRTVKSN